MNLLTKEEFLKTTKALEGDHWTASSIESRWNYHRQCVELVKSLDLSDPSKVLELGTMGITCVKGAKTMDYAEKWNFPGKQPNYLHDARKTPWPIADKEFELFIANRVYMHLVPGQQHAIAEAFRIAKRIIITVPETYTVKIHPTSKGITYKNFVEYLGGVHPNVFIKNNSENFYYWDTENPSKLNLEQLIQPRIITLPPPPTFFEKLKWKLMN